MEDWDPVEWGGLREGAELWPSLELGLEFPRDLSPLRPHLRFWLSDAPKHQITF